MLTINIKNSVKTTVTADNTAKTLESGTLDVFATPAMIQLIEKCCAQSVEAELGDDNTSVGMHLDISHLSPSPVGLEITCESILAEIDDRTLIFFVEVFDNCGIIGKGIHKRVIVNKEKFLNKANSKQII